MSVDVIVSFEATEGRAEQLLPLLREGRDRSRRANGCESFELYRRHDDPNRFVFIERWASIEAHHENMTRNIVADGHFARVLALLVEAPDNGVLVRQ